MRNVPWGRRLGAGRPAGSRRGRG